MKLIREARMGRPKQGKSGMILATYPKPMLYVQLDRSGIDIVPSKSIVLPEGYVPFDTRYEDIKIIRAHEFPAIASLPMEQQAPITCIDLTQEMPSTIDLTTQPMKSSQCYSQFVNCHNVISGKSTLPWKTVVDDSATGLTTAILSFISESNPQAYADARQWAGIAGGLVGKVVAARTALPCHYVCLLHSNVDVHPITGEVSEDPSLYGKSLRADFFGLFSQVFYAYKDFNGKPMIKVSDEHPVKGIGPRWPLGLPKYCAPDFKSIYGKELV